MSVRWRSVSLAFFLMAGAFGSLGGELAAQPSIQRSWFWRPLGVVPDVVGYLASDTRGQILKLGNAVSHDLGATWESMPPGYERRLGAKSGSLFSVFYVFGNSRTIQTFRSDDLGRTWILHAEERWPGDTTVSEFLPDLSDENRMLAVINGELHLTQDQGASWQAIPGAPSSIRELRGHPLLPGQVLGLGTDYRDIYVSADFGRTWVARPEPPTAAVVVDPSEAGVLVTRGVRELSISTREQPRFRDLAVPEPGLDGFAVGADGTLFVSYLDSMPPYDVRILASPDRGGTWEERGRVERGTFGSSGYLWAHPVESDRLFLLAGEALLMSSDGGRSFSGVSSFPGRIADAVFSQSGALVALDCDGGCVVGSSVDSGSSWNAVSSLDGVGSLQLLAADQHRSERILGLAWRDDGSACDVLESVDLGTSWRSISGPVGCRRLASSPAQSGRWYVVDQGSESIEVSTDDGTTFSRSGSIVQRAQSLTLDPHDPDRLYSDAPPADLSSAVAYQSRDRGATWQRLRTLPGFGFFLHRALVAPDPLAPGVLHLAGGQRQVAGASSGFAARLYRSTDDGSSFREIDAGVGPPRGLVDFVSSPLEPALYATDRYAARLWKLTNGGTWEDLCGSSPRAALGNCAQDGEIELHPVVAGALATVTGSRAWVLGGGRCIATATRLCLDRGRFGVEARWRDGEGNLSWGRAVSLTADTGYFWFFDEANVEVVAKVLDATAFSGYHWVFSGALTNVEYELQVDDFWSGRSSIYRNPLGEFASFGDTAAFPQSDAPYPEGWTAVEGRALRHREAATPSSSASRLLAGDGCESETVLCLNDERFEVEIDWRSDDGQTGSGRAVPLTADTGYFWFFDEANVEVVIKVLDARAVNGSFWVFFGALSNVEYAVRVTDTDTGQVQTYRNPAGTFASIGDTDAFPVGSGS